MRAFFALEPSPKDKLAIENWRQKTLPMLHKPIPAANFHLTLAFLGDIGEKQLDNLCQTVTKIALPMFSLQFDHCGYFSKPGIFWLGCQHSQALETLAHKVQVAANLPPKQQQSFVPHISLFRGCDTPPPEPLFAPELTLAFTHFGLYQSINSHHGVHYHCIQQWPLQPVFQR